MRLAPDTEAGARDADTLALAVLVDMASPPVLDLGEFGSTTIELTVHVRGRPAPGWLACRARTRHVIDGYHDEDFEIWDAKGQLVAQSRQLALLPRKR
jgi:acyl-CoA thioesterase